MHRVINSTIVPLPPCNYNQIFDPSATTDTNTQPTAPSNKRKAAVPADEEKTVVLSKNDKRQLKKIKQRETDMKIIIAANEKRFNMHIDADRDEEYNSGRRIITTVPEQKNISNNRLASGFENRKASSIITAGNYIFVEAAFSPRKNRPAANGYVIAIGNNSDTNLPCAIAKLCVYNTLYHNAPITSITEDHHNLIAALRAKGDLTGR